MTLKPEFHFLEVAYPYVARRLLTDEDPRLRERLIQVRVHVIRILWFLPSILFRKCILVLVGVIESLFGSFPPMKRGCVKGGVQLCKT